MNYLRILSIALLCFSSSAFAAETDLTTSQIKELLSGNTAHGVHYQKRTIQYFSESGLTLWLAAGDVKPSEGKWKAENDQYCSDFGSGWNCFKIVKDQKQGIQYYIGENVRAPFVIQNGYHLAL